MGIDPKQQIGVAVLRTVLDNKVRNPRDAEQITIAEGKEAEVLVFDLRPHELPRM